jgi:chaperonin GroES
MGDVFEKEDQMKIKPLQDRVIVKRIDQDEEVRGGIVIPDTAKEKPQEGEIVAAGDGKVLESGQKVAMSVKPGDRILFGKYSGTEVKIDDHEYLIMREDEVLGILS